MSCQHTTIEGGRCLDCDYCLHEVIYFGLCAVCGRSVDQSEESNSKDHIDINHKSTGIKVSKKEAERLEKEDERRLLQEKKLSLIIDLDQTILHAAWEPHIAKWVDEHKNDQRTREMSTFSLDGSINKYTIKLRPGLREFLKEISKYYEMHIYTMGTRAYADAVAKVIDPNGDLFQDRILSRDENGSATKKKLERLFPSDQTKVIILDDRADVWDYSPNLIQMRPYEYFAGIGDINAPPADRNNKIAVADTLFAHGTTSVDDKKTTTTGVGSTANDHLRVVNTIDDKKTVLQGNTEEFRSESLLAEKTLESNQLANISTKNSPDTVVNPQTNETPEKTLFLNSEIVNNDSTTINKQKSPSDHATNPSYTPKLQDTDSILPMVKNVLIQVHSKFYKQLDMDPAEKPNVANIISAMKSEILKSCCIVFSGVIPLQCRPEDSSLWKMATAFGAKCLTELTGKVTHLVAATVGTSKVNTARKYDSIKIVSPAWLTNSVWEWKKHNETDYLMTLPREGSIVSEVENPEESSLDFDDDKLDIDWDDSEVDAVLGEDDDDEVNFRSEGTDASGKRVNHEQDEDDGAGSDEDEDEDDVDWLLGQLDDEDEGEVHGYGEESEEDLSVDETLYEKKRKRVSDDDEDDVFDTDVVSQRKR